MDHREFLKPFTGRDFRDKHGSWTVRLEVGNTGGYKIAFNGGDHARCFLQPVVAEPREKKGDYVLAVNDVITNTWITCSNSNGNLEITIDPSKQSGMPIIKLT